TANFEGLYMDDFFTNKKEGKRAVLTLEELRNIRKELEALGKKLDIFVTFYTTELDLPLHDYLDLIGVIVLWTWKPVDLLNLDFNLDKLHKFVPHKKILLGCYMVDFDQKKSISIPDMERQC